MHEKPGLKLTVFPQPTLLPMFPISLNDIIYPATQTRKLSTIL